MPAKFYHDYSKAKPSKCSLEDTLVKIEKSWGLCRFRYWATDIWSREFSWSLFFSLRGYISHVDAFRIRNRFLFCHVGVGCSHLWDNSTSDLRIPFSIPWILFHMRDFLNFWQISGTTFDAVPSSIEYLRRFYFVLSFYCMVLRDCIAFVPIFLVTSDDVRRFICFFLFEKKFTLFSLLLIASSWLAIRIVIRDDLPL